MTRRSFLSLAAAGDARRADALGWADCGGSTPIAKKAIVESFDASVGRIRAELKSGFDPSATRGCL